MYGDIYPTVIRHLISAKTNGHSAVPQDVQVVAGDLGALGAESFFGPPSGNPHMNPAELTKDAATATCDRQPRPAFFTYINGGGSGGMKTCIVSTDFTVTAPPYRSQRSASAER